jgi:ferritin-like metal-binding protein YciE
MAGKTLGCLFHAFLKDAYYVERRLARALPKMAKGSNCPALAAVLEVYCERTQEQARRLEEVFVLSGRTPEEKIWPVIDGVIDEGLELLQHYKASPALGAGLVAVAQTIAHYEITRYGTLMRWAGMLGMREAAALLCNTLAEELLVGLQLDVLADGVAQTEGMLSPPEAASPAQSLSQAA